MNKTCIITGGAKRIGKELCRKLAASGWNIVIHYNQSHQEAKELKEEILKMGVKAKIFKANSLWRMRWNTKNSRRNFF